MIKMGTVKKELKELLGGYDFICVLCGTDLFKEELFCPRCAKNIYLNDKKVCAKCGTAIYGEEDYCSKCSKTTRYFDKAVSVFRFEGDLKRVFYDFKFFGQYEICRRFAPLLKQTFLAAFDFTFDYITYVPMSAAARKERGYNQSQLICQAFCDIMKFSAPTPLVNKIKDTSAQEGLSFPQRTENVKGAFQVSEEYKSEIKDKTILIVDDVLTTGATTDEIAKILKKKGAEKVCVLSVASRAEVIPTE